MKRVYRLFRMAVVTVILKIRYLERIQIAGLIQKPITSKIKCRSGWISIGRNLSIETNVHIVATNGGKINIGDSVFFNRNCILVARDNVSIGKKCLFGPNVCIYDHDHKFDANGVASTDYKTSPIEIGDGCWIGAGAIILRGSRIGEGSIIGAGAIIKGEIPKRSIVTVQHEQHVHALHT